jgi:hypothetical protein
MFLKEGENWHKDGTSLTTCVLLALLPCFLLSGLVRADVDTIFVSAETHCDVGFDDLPGSEILLRLYSWE